MPGIAIATVIGTALGKCFDLDFTNFDSIVSIILYSFLVCLALLWIHSGAAELRYFEQWVRTARLHPRRPFVAMAAVAVVSGFFVLLIAVSNHLEWLFSIFSAYLVFDIFTWKVRRDEIRLSIEGAGRFLLAMMSPKADAAEPASATNSSDAQVARIFLTALEEISFYYFKRPHIRRLAVTLVPCVVLAAISWSAVTDLSFVTAGLAKLVNLDGIFANWNIFSRPGKTLALTIFLVTISLSEFVLSRWRLQLREHLYNAGDTLSALQETQLVKRRQSS